MASEIKVDTISEKTSANGVTIDSLSIKDGGLVAAGNIDVNGNNLVLDANANTYLDAGTDDTIKFYVAGAHDLTISANAINVLSGTTLTIDSGATITNSGTATGFGALAGIDDQTSSNDDQLTITDSAVIINEDSDDLDFRVESNGDANCLFVDGGNDNVGISNSAPDTDAKFHISQGGYRGSGTDKHALLVGADIGDAASMTNATRKMGSIVAPHYTNAEEPLTIARIDSNSGSSFLSIGGTAETNTVETVIIYTATDDADKSTLLNSLNINMGKLSTGGDQSPDITVGGLCLNQGANDENLISLKSSDVAHGTTSVAETDTYGFLRKREGVDGGLLICGLVDTNLAIQLQGIPTAVDTAKSTSAIGSVEIDSRLKDGAGTTAMSADANLLIISNDNTTRFVFDAEGSFHADVESTTYDSYDDAQLVRAFDLAHKKGVIESKFDKFIAYNHEKLADMKLVGREEDGTPNTFINVTKFQQLHNGAIWQQYEKHERLLEAVYDLAKEAVGEEKANAILDKHEVKRLQ